MPTILGANSDTGAFEISNSLRFDDGGSERLYFDPSSDDSTRTKYTFSTWLKLGNLATSQHRYFFGAGDHALIGFRTGSGEEDDLYVQTTAGGVNAIQTHAKFRDSSAWYHIYVKLDTTQSTASDRLQLYVNGVQVTDFSVDQRSNITQDSSESDVGSSGERHNIGYSANGSGSFYDGYIAETHLLVGTVKNHTDFGETNDNGVWVPKKAIFAASDYGTNGFKLEYKQTGTSADASGMGADTSGNGNHFTTQNLNAQNITTDTPNNNFATLDPTSNFHCGATYAEGNTRFISDESKYGFNCSTVGVSSGKWYAEFKMISRDGESGNWYMVGIASGEQTGHRLVLGRDTGRSTSTRNGGIGYVGYGTNFIYQNDAYYDGDSNAYSTAAYTDDDIIGVALNADDNQVTLYKNGTVQNSGTAFVLGTSETGFWHFGCGHFDTGNTFTIDANFGQPSFSGTDQSDANGYGSFEYAPPNGYYALCTKNLAEYG